MRRYAVARRRPDKAPGVATAGRSMTTVWGSRAATDASAQWAQKACEHAAHDSGAVVEPVWEFEVALTAEKPALR